MSWLSKSLSYLTMGLTALGIASCESGRGSSSGGGGNGRPSGKRDLEKIVGGIPLASKITDENGTAFFKEGEEDVPVTVRDFDGNPINDATVLYFDLPDAKTFVITPTNNLPPLTAIASHNSGHDYSYSNIHTSVLGNGVIKTEYNSGEREFNEQAAGNFHNMTRTNDTWETGECYGVRGVEQLVDTSVTLLKLESKYLGLGIGSDSLDDAKDFLLEETEGLYFAHVLVARYFIPSKHGIAGTGAQYTYEAKKRTFSDNCGGDDQCQPEWSCGRSSAGERVILRMPCIDPNSEHLTVMEECAPGYSCDDTTYTCVSDNPQTGSCNSTANSFTDNFDSGSVPDPSCWLSQAGAQYISIDNGRMKILGSAGIHTRSHFSCNEYELNVEIMPNDAIISLGLTYGDADGLVLAMGEGKLRCNNLPETDIPPFRQGSWSSIKLEGNQTRTKITIDGNQTEINNNCGSFLNSTIGLSCRIERDSSYCLIDNINFQCR